jgi:RNA polymerase sigma-70 factor (ECF subfamily)
MIDDKLHKKEMQLQIRKLVLEMDEPHRTVVSLRYFDELSLKEIADIMDTSEGTVKSRLFYGLKKLSLLLKNEQAA